jgi:hypothetical protein
VLPLSVIERWGLAKYCLRLVAQAIFVRDHGRNFALALELSDMLPAFTNSIDIGSGFYLMKPQVFETAAEPGVRRRSILYNRLTN